MDPSNTPDPIVDEMEDEQQLGQNPSYVDITGDQNEHTELYNNINNPNLSTSRMKSSRKTLRIAALEQQISLLSTQVSSLVERLGSATSTQQSPRSNPTDAGDNHNTIAKPRGHKHLRLSNFKCDSSVSAADWLSSFNHYALMQGWNEVDKSENIFFFLEGHAVRWYHNITREHKPTWFELTDRFLERFGISDERHFDQLRNLKWNVEKESLEDYFHRALNLTDRETDQRYRCSILSTGLPETYRRHLIFTDVSNVSTWFNLVNKYHIHIESTKEVKTAKSFHKRHNRINNLNDNSKLNQLASRPPIDQATSSATQLSAKSRPMFKPCEICGKTNHSAKRCFKRPGYRNKANNNNNNHNNNSNHNNNNNHGNPGVHANDPINKMIEYNDALFDVDNYQPVSLISDPECRYAWLRIDGRIDVKALIDSGAKPTAIDLDLCVKHGICIHPQKRTLAHVLQSFETEGTANILVSNGKFSHTLKADVVKMLGEQFIIGVKDFKELGYSLQGPGLIARLDDDSPSNQQSNIMALTDLVDADSMIMQVREVPMSEQLTSLLDKHDTIFSKHDFDVGHSDLLYCYIHLIPGEKPHAVPPRRLALKLVEEEKKQIKTLLEHGLIERSFSNWAAGITFVCKEGKQPRLCGDYRVLNTKTLSDKYPIPRIDFIINNLKGAKVYSKLDLTRGYNNIKIAPEDRYKTAFVTNNGLYQWTRMPFGLKNAPAIFQRYMEIVISKCSDFAQVYFDDIIVFSKTDKEHLAHLELLFNELRSYNVKLKRPKCTFLTNKITFCGHVIEDGMIRRDASYVEAIDRIKKPEDVKELYQFMGLANYGRNFIPDFAEITRPLNILRRKGAEYLWSKEQDIAFELIKHKLKEGPSIYLFDPTLPTILYTDASIHSIGAILVQERKDRNAKKGLIEVPVGYFSKTLNETQVKYNIYVKELLALVKALEFFKEYLYGRRFSVVTDNAALSYFRTSKDIAAAHTRWLMFIEEFDFGITHKPAASNKAADALSRLIQPDAETQVNAINYNEFYRELHDHVYVQKLPPREIEEKHVDFILDYVHKVRHNHAGFNTMERSVRKIAKFPNMNARIQGYLLRCKACRMFNPHSHRIGMTRPMQVPDQPNGRWFVDFIQNLPMANGFAHILVAVDHTSRVAIARPVKRLDARSAIRELERMFRAIGAPKELVTDNGSCFTADIFHRYIAARKIKHVLAPAYNHASNGIVERFNRTLQEALAKYCFEDKKTTWLDHLRPVIQRYNNTVHRVTKDTPMQLKVRGASVPEANIRTTAQQQYDANRLNKTAITPKIQVGDLVFFKNLEQTSLQPPFKQLYKVVEFINPEILIIANVRGRKDKRRAHVNNVKLWVKPTRTDHLVVQPPQRTE